MKLHLSSSAVIFTNEGTRRGRSGRRVRMEEGTIKLGSKEETEGTRKMVE